MKEIQQFDWWRAASQPLLWCPKSKGERPPKCLHDSTFGTFGGKSLGTLKMETQTLVERPNFFVIKYSKSDSSAATATSFWKRSLVCDACERMRVKHSKRGVL